LNSREGATFFDKLRHLSNYNNI